MARPKSEGLDYFPHDTGASGDLKIKPLLLLYGAKGYAFYFLHLEYIYRNETLDLDVSDAETRQILSSELKITTEDYDQILQSCLKKDGKGCFSREYYEETGKLSSNGIKKRAAVVVKKRENMRQQYENKKKNISDAETIQETIPETPQSKEKQSKEKQSKEKQSKVILSSSLERDRSIPLENDDESKKSITVIELEDQGYKDAIKFYSNNINPMITQFETETITDYLHDVDSETLILAMKLAIEAKARNWRYIKTILNSWIAAGVKTLPQAEEYQREWKSNQGKGSAIERLEYEIYEEFGNINLSDFPGGPECKCRGKGSWNVNENGECEPPGDLTGSYRIRKLCPCGKIKLLRGKGAG